MKDTLILLVSNIVSISCVITAAILAYGGKSGYGWFLLVAVLCVAYLKYDDKK